MMNLARPLARWGAAALFIATTGLVLGWLPGGCTPMVNHFAFFPDQGRDLDDSSLPPGARHVTFTTDDQETIEGYFVPATSQAERLVLYFHGNAGNIAQRFSEIRAIAEHTGAAVFGSGYRGYGQSTGTPSEAGIYSDGEAAVRYARETLGYAPASTVVIGRSLGSTVATHLASRGEDFAGIVLITPLSTGRDYGRTHLGFISVMAGRSFDSLGRAGGIHEPALVLHGLDDAVIPYEYGRKLFDALPGPKQLVTIAHAGHNNLEFIDPHTFWRELTAFVISPRAHASAGP